MFPAWFRIFQFVLETKLFDELNFVAMPSTPTESALNDAKKLYASGLYVQCARILEPFGSPVSWQGTEARVFGARLANNLGAPRLSRFLTIKAFRADPSSTLASYYFALYLYERQGALSAWEFLRRIDVWQDSVEKADALGLRARICALFRDRKTFRQALDQAIAIAPDNAFLFSEEAMALELLDEPEQARERLRVALQLHPWTRSAVQQLLHSLLNANEDEEADALFRESTSRWECGAIFQQWIVMKSERGEFTVIPELCERARSLLIWAETPILEWLDCRQAEAHWHLGESDKALLLGESAHLSTSLLDRLREQGQKRRRRILNVPFVAQDDSTCAPASLASVAAFWQWDISHDEIADSVCYGGTYAHGLRAWVEARGWYVQEFRVTLEACRRLIDAGYPFLLATVDLAGGHMQVVEGYDEDWGTLLIRDPNFRHHRIVDAVEFLKRYEAFGPRGMVVVPSTEIATVEALNLPEKLGFDALYRLAIGLDSHRREDAVRELSFLQYESPFLHFAAQLCLADYDADDLARYRCLKDMETAGFKHPFLAGLLLDTGRNFSQTDRVESLRRLALCRNDNTEWDAVFLLRLAMALSSDERNISEVRRLFGRYHLLQPRDAVGLSFWGGILRMHRLWDEALDTLRFAATCGSRIEGLAMDYFHTARLRGQENMALDFLRQRVGELGAKSSAPAQTLYQALRAVNQEVEAFEVLVEALARRPDDAQMQLFCAYEYGALGYLKDAEALLNAARDKSRQALWLRTAGSMAMLAGDLQKAEDCWREVAAIEPLALDALDEIAKIVESRSGLTASLVFWEERCRRFPCHLGFAERRAITACRLESDTAEGFLRGWAQMESDNVEARIILSAVLCNQGRYAEALAEAEIACLKAPHDARCRFREAECRRFLNDTEHAILGFKEAFLLNVNYEDAVRRLWMLVSEGPAALEMLNFIETQVFLHPTAEAGLFVWVDMACAVKSSAYAGSQLAKLLTQRPTQWAVWNAVMKNELQTGNLEGAVAHAVEATSRFSFLPAVWDVAGSVYEKAGQPEQALLCYQRSSELNPFAVSAWVSAALLLERLDRVEEAKARIAEGVRRNPLIGNIRAIQAGFIWRGGRREEALRTMQSALWLAPELEWAWEEFGNWCQELKLPSHAREFSATLQNDRPGNLHVLLAHAHMLGRAGLLNEAEQLCRKAIDQQPQMLEAWLFLIRIVSTSGRMGDARGFLGNAVWKNSPPTPLLGQVALAEWQRNQPDQAIELMEQALQRDPSYVWGLERITEWFLHLKKYPKALNSARRLTELSPERGLAWRQLASIYEEQGQDDEAFRYYREAVVREPSAPASLLILIQKLLQKDRVNEAVEAWRMWGGSILSPFREAGECVIQVIHGQTLEARVSLEKLFKSPDASVDLIRFVHDILMLQDKGVVFREALNASIWQPDASASTAIFWTEKKLENGKWAILDSLLALSSSSGARRAALHYFLTRLSDAGRTDGCAKLMHDHGDIIRHDDELWSDLGYCLLLSQPTNAWHWMKDWRDRGEATPWMLRSAAVAALACGYKDEAFAIARSAVSSSVHDQAMGFHHALVSMELTSAGNLVEAKSELVHAENLISIQWDKGFLHIAKTFESMASRNPNQLNRIWEQARLGLSPLGVGEDFLLKAIAQSLAGRRFVSRLTPQTSSSAGEDSHHDSPSRRGVSRGLDLASVAYASLGIGLGAIALAFASTVFFALVDAVIPGAILLIVCFGVAALSGVLGTVSSAVTVFQKHRTDMVPNLLGNIGVALGVGVLVAIAYHDYSAKSLTSYSSSRTSSTGELGLENAALIPSSAPVSTPAREMWELNPGPDIIVDRAELDRAAALRASGRAEEAIPVLRELLAKNPGSASVMVELSYALQNANQSIEAVDLARKALEIEPQNPDTWFALGSACLVDNQLVESEKCVRKGMEMNASSPNGWRILGYNLALQKRWDEAVAAFEKLLALDASQMEPWLQIAQCYRDQNDSLTAERTLERLVKLYPWSAPGWYVLGGTMCDAGMPSRGLVALKKAVDLQPRLSEAWNSMGLCYMQLNDGANAIACYREAIASNARDPEPLNNLGFAILSQGDSELAATLLEKAIALQPKHEKALVNLIVAYLKEGKTHRAGEICDLLAAVNPDLAESCREKIYQASQ